jgi:hypothetical protein
MPPEAPNSRDDFSSRTKKIIAQRSGYRCAICGCQTDGPTLDPNNAISIGDAAHITAASPLGPRYNSTLTPEQRSAPENGLWACKNHHWTIDHDKDRYPIEELVRKKATAEERARLIQGIEDAHGVEIATAVAAARGASERMIEQWRIKYRFNQTEVIELDFRETSREEASGVMWTLAQVSGAVAQGHKLVLTGRPGAGKTITLIQLAERLSANAEGPVPLIFSVSGWIASNRDLASYVTAQLTNAGMSADAGALLFSTGRLAIILNGWNEAPDADQARASEQLNDFLLNHGSTGLILSTRATRHSPALVGETVLEVVPLTSEKKESIVRTANLPDPATLLRQTALSRTLDEVTQTPLFLAAAIKLARAGRPIPTTRSGLLESFLADLQETDNHAVRLRTGPCQDFHYRYQTALAVEMARQGLTILPTERAQLVIGTCSTTLIAAGLIGQAGAAPSVAESLAQHHALVYLPDGGPGYGFIHQQFQEWFASRWLLDELRRLAACVEGREIFALQRDVLNRPAWAEAVGFAMESLIAARATDNAASLVRWMMPVDLIRAAELTKIGGPELWAAVGNELARALRRWHDLGGAHRDCALTAMLASGRPDFADLIWPQLEAGEQSMFHVCRLHEPFRVAVLGPGWADRMGAWPERLEMMFLLEIASDAAADEIAYADLRAQQGPLAVRVAAFKLLAEHGRFARVLEILLAPEFGEWSEEIHDDVIPDIPARLLVPHADSVRRSFDTTDSLLRRAGIVEFLRRASHPQWVELAQAELNRALAALRAIPLFSIRTRDTPAPPEMRAISLYTHMLWRTHSAWTADWLVANFGENLLHQEPLSHWLKSFPEDAMVALATRIVAAGGRAFRRSTAVEYLLGSGSARVAAIFIDAYVTAKLAGQEPLDLPRMSETLRQSSAVPRMLIDAILARAENVTDFRQLNTLIDAISPVSALDGSLGGQIEPRQRDALRALIMRASAAIPTDLEARNYRPTLAVLLGSLGAPEDVAVVSRWVTEENARWEEYRRQVAEAAAARPPRRVRHYGTSWWNWYAGALALFRCPEAEAEFFRWLEHPWLAAEGADGLVDLSLMDGSLPQLPETGAFQRLVPRPTRPLNDVGPAVRRRADGVVRAIERLVARPADDFGRQRFLPQMAAALGRLNDPRAVERLLTLDGARIGWTPLGAFLSMQARGSVLPGRRMAQTLEAFIASHEAEAHSSNDQWYAAVKALRLLLFSDEPAVAIERMRRLPAQRVNSYHARDIFALLAESPAPEAASLLLEFSNLTPLRGGAFGQLIEALATSLDRRCHARLLELLHVPEEELPSGSQSELHHCILSVAERDAAFRLQLTDAIRRGTVRWAQPPKFGPSVGTAELFEAMLREADLRPVERELRQLIDELSETHEPAGSPGSYYVFPADATAIKQRLARLLPDGGHNAEVASRLLASLRLKRAERGQPAKEPLHPDVALLETRAVSWPIRLH